MKCSIMPKALPPPEVVEADSVELFIKQNSSPSKRISQTKRMAQPRGRRQEEAAILGMPCNLETRKKIMKNLGPTTNSMSTWTGEYYNNERSV